MKKTKISKTSWHYKLIEWQNGYFSAEEIENICEYWKAFAGAAAAGFLRILLISSAMSFVIILTTTMGWVAMNGDVGFEFSMWNLISSLAIGSLIWCVLILVVVLFAMVIEAFDRFKKWRRYKAYDKLHHENSNPETDSFFSIIKMKLKKMCAEIEFVE